MDVGSEYTKVCNSLERTDPEFSKALRKWYGHFCSVVFKVHAITKVPLEDVFQRILTELVRIRGVYLIPLFRYHKYLYEVSGRDGSLCYLSTPRHNRYLRRSFWIPSSFVEPVKKASLSSMIYRELTQQMCDIIAAFFCQKNGYEVKEQEVEGAVVSKSGDRGLVLKKKRVKVPTRVVEVVSLQDVLLGVDSGELLVEDTVETPMLGPEDQLLLKEKLGLVGAGNGIFHPVVYNTEEMGVNVLKKSKW